MKVLLITVISLLLGLGVSYLFFQQKDRIRTVSYVFPSPTPISFAFNPEDPPKDSLVGEISSPSGEIQWQSRDATVSSALNDTTAIKQGETLILGDKSSLVVNFSATLTIKLFSNSILNFVQTLPVNTVISQTQGSAEYHPLGSTPISVRTLHLLTNINDSDVIITLDPDQELVYLDVYSGSVTLGYNNVQYITQNIVYPSGKRLIFNDGLRKVTLKDLPPED